MYIDPSGLVCVSHPTRLMILVPSTLDLIGVSRPFCHYHARQLVGTSWFSSRLFGLSFCFLPDERYILVLAGSILLRFGTRSSTALRLCSAWCLLRACP